MCVHNHLTHKLIKFEKEHIVKFVSERLCLHINNKIFHKNNIANLSKPRNTMGTILETY